MTTLLWAGICGASSLCIDTPMLLTSPPRVVQFTVEELAGDDTDNQEGHVGQPIVYYPPIPI